MGSPLQGASCTSGGVIRGKASGNVLSHADAPEILEQKIKSVKGEVRLFTSLVDPTNLKPVLIVKTNIDTNLALVLKQMRKKYLPIEGEKLQL